MGVGFGWGVGFSTLYLRSTGNFLSCGPTLDIIEHSNVKCHVSTF